MDFFDAHVHILPSKRLRGLTRWIKRMHPERQGEESIECEDILTGLRRVGVKYFFNLVYPLKPEETRELNRFNHELGKKIKNIIPFGSLHQDNEDKLSIVDEAIGTYGLLGLKFHSFVQYFDPYDKRMLKVYEKMTEINRPIIFHTGFHDLYKQRIPPENLKKLLGEFPQMTVVFAHMLYPNFALALELLEENEKLYFDITNVLGYLKKETSGHEDHKMRNAVFLFENIVNRFSKRIMFGSEYPIGTGSIEEVYGDIKYFEISAQARADIFFNTAYNFVKNFWPHYFDGEKNI